MTDIYTHDDDDKAWNAVKIVYILHLLGAFTGLPVFIGAIISHLKSSDGGRAANSHFKSQIRTFWTFVIVFFVGIVTTWLLIGFAIMALAWLWFVFKMITGLMRASDFEAIS